MSVMSFAASTVLKAIEESDELLATNEYQRSHVQA